MNKEQKSNYCGECGDFHKHEDIERVTGDGDAQQSGEAQGEQGVEQVVLVGRNLLLNAGAAVGQRNGGHTRYDQQHEARQPVHAVLDAPRRWPVADGIGDRRAIAGIEPQGDGGGKSEARGT